MENYLFVKNVMVIVLILLLLLGLQVKYIIGGVMIYVCLGDDIYEIILKIYWDGNCIDCVDFDVQVFIVVYNCLGNCFG